MRQPAVLNYFGLARSEPPVRGIDPLRSRRRWMALVIGNVIFSVVSGVTGIVLAAVSFVGIAEINGRLSFLSSILITATFAALIFGAHCLDRVDAADHKARVAAVKEKLPTVQI